MDLLSLLFDKETLIAVAQQVLVLVITALVIPAIYRAGQLLSAHTAALHIHANSEAERAMWEFVLSAVKAAQQMLPDKSTRYSYVADSLAAKYPYIPAAELKLLIEAAVHTIKQWDVPVLDPIPGQALLVTAAPGSPELPPTTLVEGV